MIQAVTGTHMPIQYATSPCLWGGCQCSLLTKCLIALVSRAVVPRLQVGGQQ